MTSGLRPETATIHFVGIYSTLLAHAIAPVKGAIQAKQMIVGFPVSLARASFSQDCTRKS
jgi:hypothetical protein